MKSPEHEAMAVVGFEPTPLKRLEPKSSALDPSATLPLFHGVVTVVRQMGFRQPFQLLPLWLWLFPQGIVT